jgi:hypothetical protein
MSDLVEFLRERLDEDDEAALDMHARDWTLTGRDIMTAGFVIAEASSDFTAHHIARHDPARVLREVAAKRAILAGHSTVTGWNWPDQSDGSVQMDYVEALRRTLRHLAAVYSDHPDYDEAWRP